ncbi:SGNH/GDSL hydrolase family protein [Luteolibacter sp. LG18]|uniref:SGNH/GDSL hydrolase family protein n=1 Tax=Luteolibacter sp. LG18 TaxID=2819286 RepID=UPI002B31FFEE|nr:hypothetical protein llg_41000 [Luteolibacter sp. LG18]
MRPLLLAIIALTAPAVSTGAEANPSGFALQDGDTVAFLGDSITAARNYSKIVEDYTLMRFPERKIRFLNVARGGETAQAALERLQNAVLDQHVTVLTVAYGINDIGWGTKADSEHEAAYLDGLDKIITRCQEKGIRVFICSAAITSIPPDEAEKGFLQQMCDKGLALAKERHAGTIDLMRPMREVQRRVIAANANEKDPAKHTLLHTPDGVHLNDLGQMAMAWAMLKGLGAPADSSSAMMDARLGMVVRQEACKIGNVAMAPDSFKFTRLDDRLPFNLSPLWVLMGWHIPLSEDLNRYQLTIAGLSPGTYEITADGRGIGKWNEQQLAKGINIASASAVPGEPGGPWQIQGQLTAALTNVRDELEAISASESSLLPKDSGKEELIARTRAIEGEIVALQRDMARPVPVAFEVKKTAAKE